MDLNDSFELYNGVRIPKLGLGSWLVDDDKVTEAVRQALELG